MNIKNWFIKKLGGITKCEQEDTRVNYEKWAVDHLVGKNGEVIPDCWIYNPFDGDDILVLRSKVKILDGRVTAVNIAPWCKYVSATGLIIVGKNKKLKVKG